jgi:hypothetical protein
MPSHRCDLERKERILSEAIESVAAELRLVDVADFIAYIRFEQFANIQDIVSSSTELFFKSGTLNYGGAADFELDWSAPPLIILDLEFQHHEVAIAFKLALRANRTSVVIRHFSVEQSNGDLEMEICRMIEALADARLQSPNN